MLKATTTRWYRLIDKEQTFVYVEVKLADVMNSDSDASACVDEQKMHATAQQSSSNSNADANSTYCYASCQSFIETFVIRRAAWPRPLPCGVDARRDTVVS